MSAIPGVIGFFTADEVPYNERRGGQWLNGFASTEAYRRVQAGYGCGSCLAKFSVYMPKCPVCGLERDVAADLKPDPGGWQSFYTDHLYGTGDGEGGPTRTRTVDEALASIAADPDVENIPLRKLMPSRHGRGRPS